MEDINHRLNRIYSAIDVAEESDPKKLRALVIQTDKSIEIVQDFRRGLTNPDLSNQAHTVIYNIAHFGNHLRKWAGKNKQYKTMIKTVFDKCVELQIIQDLADNDKHGYPPNHGGRSRKTPKLININRVMRLQTQPKKGSWVTMTLGIGGTPAITGDGTAKAVITGDIVDKNNQSIGDLSVIASKAIDVWEKLLSDFGLLKPSS